MSQLFTILNTSENPSHSSVVEKKSEFIGNAAQCLTVEEALAFVEGVRRNHPKARHVAFAAVFLTSQGVVGERMSDDGEPSGTAGKPLLEVLRKASLSNCAVTVTRYFGGVLLGSAGLMRAYSTTASKAVHSARKAVLVKRVRAVVVVDYAQLETLDHVLALANGVVESREYAGKVRSEVVVDEALWETFSSGIRNAFQAGVSAQIVAHVQLPRPLL